MRRLLAILAATVIILSLSTALAYGDDTRAAEEVVYQLVRAVNGNLVDQYLGVHTSSNQADFRSFMKTNGLTQDTFFNEESARIKEIRVLPNSVVQKFSKVDNYLTIYADIRSFYVGIEYRVTKENEFCYNGVNYRLVILGMEEGEWRIIQQSAAPVEAIRENGLGFHSKEEDIAVAIAKEKRKGNIVNAAGKLLSTNKNTSVKLNVTLQNELNNSAGNSIGVSMSDPYDEPEHIRVLLLSTNTVLTRPFSSYVKDVLPNEWRYDASWPDQALYAGAIACKTFGWFHVLNPLYPGAPYYAHVSDSPVNSQRFILNSAQNRTSAAIDMVSSAAWLDSSLRILHAQHRAGTQGQSGTQSSGYMSQWGTQHFATHTSYSWWDMADYYYSFSPKSPGSINVLFYGY